MKKLAYAMVLLMAACSFACTEEPIVRTGDDDDDPVVIPPPPPPKSSIAPTDTTDISVI